MNLTLAPAAGRRARAPWLWLWALGALAAPAAGEIEICWDDLRIAAGNHPLAGMAAADLAAAEAELAAMSRYPNPVVGFALGQTRTDATGSRGRVWETEAAVPVPVPPVWRGRVAAARAERSAVADEADGARRDALAGLRALVWEIDHGQEALSLLEQARAQLGRLVDVARLRVAHGEARPLEATQLEVELARADLDVRAAESRLAARQRALALWLPGTLPAEFRLASELAHLPELPPAETAAALALARQPALQAARQRALAAGHLLRAERHARWPELTVGAFYEREPEGERYGGRVELALPLWNWNGPAIQRARAQAARAEHRLRHEATLIEVQAGEIHAAAASARERALRYRDELMPRTEQTALALERLYRVGEADLLELLSARREAIQMGLEMWAALLEAQLTAQQLTLLMGGDDHE
ncbi:MAG: TolC family protein [Candidatus Eisenbacteria bacterium]|uniref:TolC family protein n=1 Tax=Eiseniibacteriota bacterium TaxID=2212470 RepID=A0A937XCI1_UNCEI|nr:TolC family protein [Candidatus Eisenbacteria bacterium]